MARERQFRAVGSIRVLCGPVEFQLPRGQGLSVAFAKTDHADDDRPLTARPTKPRIASTSCRRRTRRPTDDASAPSNVARSTPAAAPLSNSADEAYNRGMTKGTQAVLADALRLDSAARAELAAEILASLDGPADPDAEAAWNDEIDRRIEAIEAGTIRLEPWEHVKRRLEKDLLGR